MVAKTREGICCCSSAKITLAVACFQIVLYTSGAVSTMIALALVSGSFEAIFSVITEALARMTVPFVMIQYIMAAVIGPDGNQGTDITTTDGNNQVLDLRGIGQYWIPSLSVTLIFQILGVVMGLVLFHGANKRKSNFLTAWFIYAIHICVSDLLEMAMGDQYSIFQIIFNSFAMWVAHVLQDDIIGAEGQDDHLIGLRSRKSQMQQAGVASVPLLFLLRQ